MSEEATDGLDVADSLAGLAEDGLLHPDPVRRKVASQILTWLERGDEKFEDCLGMTAPGRSNWRTRLRGPRRDEVLRVISAMPEFRHLSKKAAAQKIRQAFLRYETSAWRRDQAADRLPDTEPLHSFAVLLRDGLDIPSVERLRKILSPGHFPPGVDDQPERRD